MSTDPSGNLLEYGLLEGLGELRLVCLKKDTLKLFREGYDGYEGEGECDGEGGCSVEP
jgi:hypothetical protein